MVKEQELPLYVVARNRLGRPTLQHKLLPGTSSLTACGVDMTEWSRAFQREPIHAILCKRANCYSTN